MFDKPQTIRLYFKLVTKRKQGPAQLYCRATLNSDRCHNYTTGVYVPIEAWITKLQGFDPAHPQADAIRQKLDEIRQQHQDIYEHQCGLVLPNGQPFFVTIETIKAQWVSKKSPVAVLTLREVYEQYVAYIRALPRGERLAAKTLEKYRYAGEHMVSYLKLNHQETLPADHITAGWGRQFYDYMRAGGMGATTATVYFRHVKAAMQHAYNYDRVKANPLDTVRFRGSRAKPIRYLTAHQIDLLNALPLTGTAHYARQWGLLMCCTGLDYNDALEVVKNVGKYRVETDNGPKLIYQRLKYAHAPQYGECHIPLLPEPLILLSEAPTWKRPRLRNQNDYLNNFGETLGLLFPFCSKVCRKTAGAWFLRKGFDIYGVQKILGHASVKMTEKHYCSLPGEVIDKQMGQVMGKPQTRPTAPITGNPFLKIDRTLNAVGGKGLRHV